MPEVAPNRFALRKVLSHLMMQIQMKALSQDNLTHDA